MSECGTSRRRGIQWHCKRPRGHPGECSPYTLAPRRPADDHRRDLLLAMSRGRPIEDDQRREQVMTYVEPVRRIWLDREIADGPAQVTGRDLLKRAAQAVTRYLLPPPGDARDDLERAAATTAALAGRDAAGPDAPAALHRPGGRAVLCSEAELEAARMVLVCAAEWWLQTPPPEGLPDDADHMIYEAAEEDPSFADVTADLGKWEPVRVLSIPVVGPPEVQTIGWADMAALVLAGNWSATALDAARDVVMHGDADGEAAGKPFNGFAAEVLRLLDAADIGGPHRYGPALITACNSDLDGIDLFDDVIDTVQEAYPAWISLAP